MLILILRGRLSKFVISIFLQNLDKYRRLITIILNASRAFILERIRTNPRDLEKADPFCWERSVPESLFNYIHDIESREMIFLASYPASLPSSFFYPRRNIIRTQYALLLHLFRRPRRSYALAIPRKRARKK